MLWILQTPLSYCDFSLHFLSFSFKSLNLCGILDLLGYKAQDFTFIHESIWFDLGRFKNWLIDCRGLNLGDVVPFRLCRLPGPTFLVSNDGQTSTSDEEETFISASSTASKATSLPEHLNDNGWELSSSRAMARSDIDVSSIENWMESSPS